VRRAAACACCWGSLPVHPSVVQYKRRRPAWYPRRRQSLLRVQVDVILARHPRIMVRVSLRLAGRSMASEPERRTDDIRFTHSVLLGSALRSA